MRRDARMSDWTVFIVDDDEGVRNGLSFLLRTAGHAVQTFSSATAFLEAFDAAQRGCLLLDIRMPHMTGLELQQELNRRAWRVPTIFITGHATVPSAIAALRAGAFDFIEKPLRDDALVESVSRARKEEEIAHEENLQLAETETRAALLTPREREVLELVTAGEQNK